MGVAGEVSRCVFFVHEPKSVRGAFAGKSLSGQIAWVDCRSFGWAAKAAALVTEAVQE